MIKLPVPFYDAKFDLNKALQLRRSIREYKDRPLAMQEVSELLWAAQGITSLGGFRTTPSAGSLYPLEAYVVAGTVGELPPGVYQYDPRQHSISKKVEGDVRAALASASLEQHWMSKSAAMIVLTAVMDRTTGRYGDRGVRYVFMEAGHAAQSVLLEVVGLGLGAVAVAAFSDREVQKVLRLPEEEEPLYIIPVGRK